MIRFLVLLLFGLTSSGCAAVAAGGIGVILSQEFAQGAHVAYYQHDAAYVWPRVKQTIAHLSTRQPQFDDEGMAIAATVSGGSVQIRVQPISPGACQLLVKARRYGLQSQSLAGDVMQQIYEEVERR